jgi:transposase
MPGEIERRPIFRLPIYLPHAAGTAIRVLQYDGQGFWLATKRLSKGRFRWWPTGVEPARTLRAHQAQLLLAAGNPDAEAPPAWRPLSP